MSRWVNGLVAVAVAAVAAGLFLARSGSDTQVQQAAVTRDALAQLYERASYYGALDRSLETTRTLWPVAVLPEWFGQNLPRNTLLILDDKLTSAGQATARPWIDIAPPGDRAAHPPDPVAVRRDQAQFWYNPNVGLFRARVAATIGEDDALALYNHVNGVELAELQRDTDPARTPLAYSPGTTPGPAMATLPPRPQATPPETPPEAPPESPPPSLFASDPRPTYDLPIAAAEPAPEPAPVGRARLKDRTR
ncbi:MAG: hypothetical protein AAFX76_00305 [Planctomycetota bacterium]